MCKCCFSGGIDRREFIGKTLKASGAVSLALAGGLPVMGADFLMHCHSQGPFPADSN